MYRLSLETAVSVQCRRPGSNPLMRSPLAAVRLGLVASALAGSRPRRRRVLRRGAAERARARRTAARRRDQGHAPVAVAARPDPRAARSAASSSSAATSPARRSCGSSRPRCRRRSRGWAAAAPDRDRPGGRRGAPPLLGRAVSSAVAARPPRAPQSIRREARRAGLALRAGGVNVDLAPGRGRPRRRVVLGRAGSHVRDVAGRRRRRGDRRSARASPTPGSPPR